MLTELYGLYGAKLHIAATSAVTLGAVMRQGIGVTTTVQREPTSGEPYPRWASISGQDFRPTISTRAIDAWLTQTGLQSLSITADGSHPGLVLYGQKQANLSTRAVGSLHRSFTIAKGLLCPQRLSCDHQGDAELEYSILPVYDGSNDPVAVADSVALPTAPTDAERFTLGTVKLGNVTFEGFTRLEIDFGVNASSMSAESAIWPTFARVESVTPRITLSGQHVTWWGSSYVPSAGLICSHANTAIFLRKRKVHTTFEADNQAVHRKFTACGIATVQGGFDASGNSPAEISVTLDTTYDGSTIPLYGVGSQAIS